MLPVGNAWITDGLAPALLFFAAISPLSTFQ